MASRNFTRALRSNLIAGARAFFGRRPQPGNIVSTLEQVVALLAIVFVLAGVLDKVSAPEDAEFAYWGVYSWFALLLMGLWVCALAARTLSERADTRTVLVAALATAPWALVLIWLVS